jgi:hypothetical protein
MKREERRGRRRRVILSISPGSRLNGITQRK